jgi:hypothetical protein
MLIFQNEGNIYTIGHVTVELHNMNRFLLKIGICPALSTKSQWTNPYKVKMRTTYKIY